LASDQLQKTIKRDVALSGTGLFTGERGSIKLFPAEPGFGIVFERTDLPGSPRIPARLEFVRDTFRSTRLATEKASLCMVEHLLSALNAYEIDNVLIEVEGPEIPACDGSAKTFVEMLGQAGSLFQSAPKQFLRLKKPAFWSEGGIHLIALPSEEFRISYTLHYPQSRLLGSQYYSFEVNPEGFKTEIAPCRTFALYEEIAPFIEKGLIKGGRLENAVIIKEDSVLNPEGLRFPDEMVRHKILDLIGDLSLIGVSLKAHIISVRSGHASNIALAQILQRGMKQLDSESFSMSFAEVAR